MVRAVFSYYIKSYKKDSLTIFCKNPYTTLKKLIDNLQAEKGARLQI